MSNLVRISAKAPQPLMYRTVADNFEELRRRIRDKSGVDFLAKCGDVFRDAGFTSSKDGVANRSNHKTGRAFDYDQASGALLVQYEKIGQKMYFRTFIKCSPQDGSKGEKREVKDYRGFKFNGYVVDFTQEAEKLGFKRIPAWHGWQSSYNRREFWHYQMMTDENGKLLTWDEAMLLLKDKKREPQEKVWGLNDRGPEVLEFQTRLNELGLLPHYELDGIFGPKTFAATKAFQKQRGLSVDGLIGPKTRAELMKK